MSDGALILLIFGAGPVGFATERIRHDLVALLMLAASVLLGLVPAPAAFAGFGDPAVITVAAVMVLSAAVSRSGMLERLLRPLQPLLSREAGIGIVYALLTGAASSVMNNVGAQPFELALGADQIGGAASAAVIGKARFQARVGTGVEPQRGGPFRGIGDPFSKNRIEQCEQLIIGGRLRQRRASNAKRGGASQQLAAADGEIRHVTLPCVACLLAGWAGEGKCGLEAPVVTNL